MTIPRATSGLVSAHWLAEHLHDPGVVVVDATWTAHGTSPSGGELYAQRRIPGARRFDIDAISDHSQLPVPHMLPSAEAFAAEAGLLGIGDDDLVVTFDSNGISGAASRAWWMFRVFGHDKVAVLDGGLPKWLADGHPLETAAPHAPHPKSFAASFRRELVRSLADIKKVATEGGDKLIDARSTGRFEGTAPEAWANGRGGHIPNSQSLPFTDLIDPVAKTLLPVDQLRPKLEAAGLLDGHVTVTCGSGVTACVIALALNQLGRPDAAIYDGSWAEWGLDPNLPALTGPA